MKRDKKSHCDSVCRMIVRMAVLVGVATAAAIGQDKMSPMISKPSSLEMPLDNCDFTLAHPARTDDTPGILRHGGYAYPKPLVTKENYRTAAGGLARVEVMVHPTEYQYVSHDFFGTFRAVCDEKGELREQPTRRSEASSPSQWNVLDWPIEGQQGSATVCACADRKTTRGVIGWYSVNGEKTTTVMIKFSHLDGMPKKLIDTFGEKYQSTLSREHYESQEWFARDIQKWSDIIRTQRANVNALFMAAVQLGAYDAEAFGLRRALTKRDDSSIFNQSLDDVLGRIEAWKRSNQESGPTDSSPTQPGSRN